MCTLRKTFRQKKNRSISERKSSRLVRRISIFFSKITKDDKEKWSDFRHLFLCAFRKGQTNRSMILEKVLTREQIAERIIKHGDLLVIYDGKVYRLNSWINKHPGGDLVIFHMIGKVCWQIDAKLSFDSTR